MRFEILNRSLTAEMIGCRTRSSCKLAAAPKYPSNVSRCSTFHTPESARLSFPVRQSASLARSSHGALWPDVRRVGFTFANPLTVLEDLNMGRHPRRDTGVREALTAQLKRKQ